MCFLYFKNTYKPFKYFVNFFGLSNDNIVNNENEYEKIIRAYKNLKKDDFIRQEFLNFIARGGKLFAVGNASASLPENTSAIPVESNLKLSPELLLKH